jgi:hypothetical protein
MSKHITQAHSRVRGSPRVRGQQFITGPYSIICRAFEQKVPQVFHNTWCIGRQVSTLNSELPPSGRAVSTTTSTAYSLLSRYKGPLPAA